MIARVWAALSARVPRSFSRSQLAVRGIALAAVVAVVLLSGAPGVLQLVAVAAALFAAVAPEPWGAGLSLALVLLGWVMGRHPVGSWQTLAAALLLLVEHCAQVVATSAPPRAPLGRTEVRSAARRGAWVAMATVVVWSALAAAPHVTLVPLPVVVLALLALLGGAWWLLGDTDDGPRRRSTGERSGLGPTRGL